MNNRLHKRVMLVLGLSLLGLFLYRIWFDDSGWLANQAMKQEIDHLQLDIQALEASNAQYWREIRDLRHGTAMLEEKAREDLGLIQEGEAFILFVEPD
ncbi:MAG: septum formation initiator family protein [Oceanobacter sp.]|jgi:cell division protein FtsB